MLKAREGRRGGFRPGGWSRAWQMFSGALPLLALWLAVPVTVLLGVLVLRFREPTRLVHQPVRSERLVVGGATLLVCYPQEVTADLLLVPSQTVAVRLDRAGGLAETDPVTLTVESAGPGLGLVDEDGQPVPQPARWTIPTEPVTVPFDIRFHLLPEASPLRHREVSLRFEVFGQVAELPRPISVEPSLLTGLHRLAGPGSSLWPAVLTLLTAMVGFGIQQWARLTDEGWERKKKDRALEAIETLRDHLENQEYEQGMACYLELRDSVDPAWQDGFVQERLEQVWKQAAPAELQTWVEHRTPGGASRRDLLTYGSAECLSEPEAECSEDLATLRAMAWAFENLPSAAREAPAALAALVRAKPAMALVLDEVLGHDAGARILLADPAVKQILDDLDRDEEDGEIRAGARRLLSRLPLPSLRGRPSPNVPWAKERPADRFEVARGVRALGFSVNPFGPERAELDPLLPEYGVRPAWFWDRLRGSWPALAYGPPGSGKTGLAFLLAHDCWFPPASPREPETFPVYVSLPIGLPARASGRGLLDRVAEGVAEALLQAAVDYPGGFLTLEAPGRTATAQLMVLCLAGDVPEALEPRLQHSGLGSRALGVLAEVLRLTRVHTPNQRVSETALVELLGRARPAGYSRTFALVDLQGRPDALSTPAVAGAVDYLLATAVRLAARDVYLKVFVPCEETCSLVDHIPLETVELSWADDDLREALRRRLVHVGQVSLAAVFSDPGGVYPDPDGRLVRAASSSPGRLIRLGNQVLARVEGPPLRPEHLRPWES